MSIIGLLGFINAGKGTVADHLVEQHGFIQDSFASSLKDVCSKIFGWHRFKLEGDTVASRQWREEIDVWWANELGIPKFTPRSALQLVGTDSLRNHFHSDIWFLTTKNRIQAHPGRNVVISDVRFPNEIKMVRDLGGTLVQVVRGKPPLWYDVAVLANNGDELALIEMQESFPEIHTSEWAWAGIDADIILDNNGNLDNLYTNIDRII